MEYKNRQRANFYKNKMKKVKYLSKKYIEYYDKYLYFIRRCAYNGDAEAMGTLGALYQFGNEALIKKNLDKAIYWYRKGAEKKDLISIINLASLYETGEGGAKDLKKAGRLHKLAAELGDDVGKHNWRVFKKQYPHLMK